VEDCLKIVQDKRRKAINALNKAAQNPHTLESRFKIGEEVWLEGTNLKTPYQSTKIAPKRYGPFRIIKEISPVAFQIKLPETWKIHDIFHASLLSPYCKTPSHGPNFTRPLPELIEGQEEYEIEAILNHHFTGRPKKLHYLIKWKGYPDSDNTWEPASQVHAPELVHQYQQNQTKETDKRRTTRLRTTANYSSSSPHWIPQTPP
jgi:hypothetical protein